MASSPQPSRIAVVQTAFLGDVVFTSPLVRALKRAWPQSQLTFVSTPKAAPLAACIPGVDRVVPFDKRREERSIWSLGKVAEKLGSPDLVAVPHPSLRSALLAKLTGARIRVGPAGAPVGWLYTHPVPVRGREPFAERVLDLARALDLQGTTELSLRAPESEREKARALLGGRKALGLVIGSEWETKRWPPAGWAALAERAAQRGLVSVLLGAPAERELAQAVKSAAPQVELIDAVGNSVVESLGILAECQGVVGGDSGLVHAARGLGTPTLLLFGPTDPGAHALEDHARALRLGLACQPCHAHGPRVCPLRHHDCMRKLSADRVWEALEPLLAMGRAA